MKDWHEIHLSDGTIVRVSAALIAQDPHWREHLREALAGRWAKINRSQGASAEEIP